MTAVRCILWANIKRRASLVFWLSLIKCPSCLTSFQPGNTAIAEGCITLLGHRLLGATGLEPVKGCGQLCLKTVWSAQAVIIGLGGSLWSKIAENLAIVKALFSWS